MSAEFSVQVKRKHQCHQMSVKRSFSSLRPLAHVIILTLLFGKYVVLAHRMRFDYPLIEVVCQGLAAAKVAWWTKPGEPGYLAGRVWYLSHTLP